MDRAVDASMDLLKQVQRDALEPEYHERATAPHRPGHSRAGALGALLIGVLLTIAAVQTNRQASATADEHGTLVRHVKDAQTTQEQSRARIAALDQEIASLRSRQTGPDSAGVQRLAAGTGAVAVTGPGIVITVDDGQDEEAPMIADQDMRQLVNGLWAAHAEAIAVNGHRVTARTAIRQAGSAITVDYTSLTRPYRVEAIGNPASLAGDFANTSSGRWWSSLRSQYRITFDVTTAKHLTLPADATLTTTTATARR